MDILMTSAETPSGNVWDIDIDKNIAPIISGEQENSQMASLACFLEKGTIKQLPEIGVEWSKYLTGQKSFGEIDAQIRISLLNAGLETYRPDYQIVGDKLTLNIISPKEERKFI
jgi:hypothetical protein